MENKIKRIKVRKDSHKPNFIVEFEEDTLTKEQHNQVLGEFFFLLWESRENERRKQNGVCKTKNNNQLQ